MKARDMLHYQDGTFAIKNGDEFLTTDGETPDYKSAVETIGKTLGLPFAKKGIDTFDADKKPSSTKDSAPVNEERLKSDPQYRRAYASLRERQRLSRSQITDALITKTMQDFDKISNSAKLLK
jgi:hypothetical protein